MRPKVFISRSFQSDSILLNSLSNNFECTFLSLIDFKPIEFKTDFSFDYVFFYSKNAARFFFNKYTSNIQTNFLIGCMGQGTASVLKDLGYISNFTGHGSVENIACEFLKIAKDKTVLFPRAKNSKKSIQKLLKGKIIEQDLIVYDNIKKKNFEVPDCDILVFTSPMNSEAYFTQKEYANETLVSIGETTTNHLTKMGFKNILTAEEPTEFHLAKVIKSITF